MPKRARSRPPPQQPLTDTLRDDKEATPKKKQRTESPRPVGRRERGGKKDARFVAPPPRPVRQKKKKKRGFENDEGGDTSDEGETEEHFVPPDLSKKIIDIAQGVSTGAAMDEDDEGSDVDLEYDDNETIATQNTADQADFDVASLVDPEEERLVNQFMPASSVQTRNLADIIMDKILTKEKTKRREEAAAAGEPMEGSEAGTSVAGEETIEPRVQKVYRTVGKVLSGYTSGPIPKAVKVLPSLQNWEALLLLTRPETWTPHAMYRLVRIFAGSAKENMAQRFYQSVFLPCVRDWMKRQRHLAPHYCMAIRKALFQPAAFIKGFLLPLVEMGDCTLREAMVIGTLLQRTTIPRDHAAVAMAMMSRMPYSGAASYFIRVFLDKQYKLPLQCVDAVVSHFGSSLKELAQRQYPVLWHQALLTFIQRYKTELTPPQVELLRRVSNRHSHQIITSDIRRELLPLLTAIAKRQEREEIAAKLRQ